MRFILIFIFFISLNTSVFSQITVSELPGVTHLEQLKNGVLFVRLPNVDKKVDVLKKMKQTKRTKKLIEAAEKENRKEIERMIDGFKQHYDYSKFYFFTSENTKQLLDQKYEGILLDFDNKPIEVQIDSTSHCYIVYHGIGHVSGEQDRYFRAGLGKDHGLQIQYINNGRIEDVKTHRFYETGTLTLGRLRKMVKNLDYVLKYNYKTFRHQFLID